LNGPPSGWHFTHTLFHPPLFPFLFFHHLDTTPRKDTQCLGFFSTLPPSLRITESLIKSPPVLRILLSVYAKFVSPFAYFFTPFFVPPFSFLCIGFRSAHPRCLPSESIQRVFFLLFLSSWFTFFAEPLFAAQSYFCSLFSSLFQSSFLLLIADHPQFACGSFYFFPPVCPSSANSGTKFSESGTGVLDPHPHFLFGALKTNSKPPCKKCVVAVSPLPRLTNPSPVGSRPRVPHGAEHPVFDEACFWLNLRASAFRVLPTVPFPWV